MSALNPFPDRQRLQAVLLSRDGLGWAVGVGCLVVGRIERDRECFMDERSAPAPPLALSDRHDLIVVRA